MPLAFGLFSALYGVVFAAAQTDMKRLLAYSSIENLGIIFTGLGLAIVFLGVGMPALGALGADRAPLSQPQSRVHEEPAVSRHRCGSAFDRRTQLGRLGGLIHRMPWVAWLTLVGALAMAGLPPLNGFVSEWLLLQAFLFSNEVPRPFINMLLPLGAALVALAAALAAYVMVKFFGVIFLGQPREATLSRAHDAGVLERIGLIWLALGCFALGLLPTRVIGALRQRGRAAEWRRAPERARALVAPRAVAGSARLLFRRWSSSSRSDGCRGGHDVRRAALLSPSRASRATLGLRFRRS